MPSRGISSFADSDMEDVSNLPDENSAISIETTGASPEPPKKKGGRPKGSKNRVTKPKTTKVTATRDSEAPKSRVKKTSAPKRKALEEHINGRNRDLSEDDAITVQVATPDDTVMSDAASSEDELESPKTQAIEKPVLASKARKEAPTKAASKLKSKSAKPVETKKETKIEEQKKPIPETQLEDDSPETRSPVVTRPSFKSSVGTGNHFERPIRSEPSFRHRAGSASDSERNGGDPQLRRKLGDMTRKFENVDLKYRNLRETGIVEANNNMEKLKKQCEATTAASTELIASLKKELAMQTSMAQEYRKVQKTMQTRTAENEKLLSNVTELTASLSAAQNEIRALQAKLAASRTAANAVESTNTRTPGSAMKHNGSRGTLVGGGPEGGQAAKTAQLQLKEDLYSDLTGLIIRGVKRTEEGDVYDCIQTGRNGTLHFKLAIGYDENGKPNSFEDTEFLYTPLLDENRDRDLLELLPDYLTEEITFSRQHAAKFYSRVVETLTKKRGDD